MDDVIDRLIANVRSRIESSKAVIARFDEGMRFYSSEGTAKMQDVTDAYREDTIKRLEQDEEWLRYYEARR